MQPLAQDITCCNKQLVQECKLAIFMFQSHSIVALGMQPFVQEMSLPNLCSSKQLVLECKLAT